MRRPSPLHILPLIACCTLIPCTAQDKPGLSIATFAVDVSPPIGSPLCDGLVMPARKIVDRLQARGIAIFGADQPIVLCAVDWVGIGNGGHDAWRAALARAVGTSAERVCVHTLHSHDAPGCDFEAEALLAQHGLSGRMFPVEFARQAIARAAKALAAAARKPVSITHVSVGKAKVHRVASNRRIMGEDGKVAHVRFSKCGDPKVRAMPEGVIDPWVRVLGFYRDTQPVAVLSYYATHPQSYYGSGGVSPDFVGLARNLCDAELEGARWIHFNGAGGNVAAGKYNAGRPEQRPELTQRLADGMGRAWRASRRFAIGPQDIGWRTTSVVLPPSPLLDGKVLRARLADKKLAVRERVRAARDLVWLRRANGGQTIDLACLTLGSVRVLHLPGELFVEYQLLAARLRPDLTVCTAAYGDYGPGYIGTRIAYSQGGYETGRVSRVAPAVERVLHDALRQLLWPGDGAFLAGAASTKITPRRPIRLAGYASRTLPSVDVLQDLHAKALAIVGRDGGRVLLLTADLLGVTKKLADTVCARLHDEFDLPRAAIMIATSHTHTAPALTGHLAPMYGFDAAQRARVAEYTQWVEERFVEVARAAFAQLEPVQIAWGVGTCDVAVNRRNNREAEVPKLLASGALRGPTDHSVPVLRVTGAGGRLRAVVFGYACHCTVLSLRRISGDYAGFAQAELERAHDGAVALFVAGCGGDQNPLPRREVALAQGYGKKLAASVDTVLARAMEPVVGRLRAAFELTPLKFDKVPTTAELRATLDDKNVYERRRAALLLARLERDGRLSETYPFPVQAWQFGDALTWIALGGEVVVDYSLALKRSYGAGRTFVAAYCNDVMAYIPSGRVWREGGYEGGGAMLYYGQPSRWARSVEDDVIAAVHRTVARARGRKHSLADELPRIPPKTPEDALATFRVAPGCRIELVAAEPFVIDPVDMEIDENGHIWVAEMIDYPFDDRDGHVPAGRVRVLEDVDGDGRVDRSHVFADRLSWPTAITLWDGGVFVGAAPELLYLKDTTGDGRADRREVMFTGFGRRNVQTLINNIVLRPDGWFIGAGGGGGGRIVSRRRPGSAPMLVRGRDFRFRPDGTIEALTGGGQFGHSLDDFGRRFVCNNSDHARHVVLAQRYLAHNPLFAAPRSIASIAVEGGSGPVFRRSPPEPWRIVRTRWRVAGKVGGPIEHGGAVSGYFTSATGITVYRGTALPDSYGTLIVGDVASNLVHQKKLTRNGATFRAVRAETGHELVASTDIWFRPTNFANGPDGALYVCDMYREIVEHPWSLPESIKKHLDLTSGDDRGRIWRITGADARPYRKPSLGKVSVAELVATLRRADGWWRDTAGRLLLERRDPATVTELQKLLDDELPAAGRVTALWLLSAFGRLDEKHIILALRHGDANVREVGAQLAEQFPQSTRLAAELARLADDPAPGVRFQIACTTGYFSGDIVLDALARLAGSDGGDAWFRAALLSSAGGARARALLERLPPRQAPLLRELCRVLGASGRDTDRRAVLRWLATINADVAHGTAAVLGLAEGMARGGHAFAEWLAALPGTDAALLQPLFDTAATIASDDKATIEHRRDAVRLYGMAPLATCGAALQELLAPRHPPTLQAAAVNALVSHGEEAAGTRLLTHWSQHPPALRRRILDALLRRATHAKVLLDAVDSGSVSATAFARTHLDQLERSEDATVRTRAKHLLGTVKRSSRAAVIARYQPALEKPGDANRGRQVFDGVCIACHRSGGRGNAIGPDIETVRERTPAGLLEQILDPSREINPAFLLYVVQTSDGRTLAGSILTESDTSITLQRADGDTDVVLRQQIKSLETTGRSLMPDGLEASITPTAMADLIAFLRK